MTKRILVLAAVLALWATACGSSDTSPSGVAADASELPPVTVFAASSLTNAFKVIGSNFQLANPGAILRFNFGSSTDLATQIGSEGTADVFASASQTAMDTVAANPGALNRVNFASNSLVLITPTDNPAGITSINDLANSGVQLVLAAEGVPLGDYSRASLKKEGILNATLANVVSNEPDDASVVAKITAGEADAGIVYTSDVASGQNSNVSSITIPDDVNAIATYPIAVVRGSENEAGAKAFLNYVLGSDAQATLGAYGFQKAAD
jgi:molybdate transport system substrate-binding protein